MSANTTVDGYTVNADGAMVGATTVSDDVVNESQNPANNHNNDNNANNNANEPSVPIIDNGNNNNPSLPDDKIRQNLAISLPQERIVAGRQYQLKVTGQGPGRFDSSNPSVVTVSQSGVVTSVALGYTTISATIESDDVSSPALLINIARRLGCPSENMQRLTGDLHAYVDITFDGITRTYMACPYMATNAYDPSALQYYDFSKFD